MKLIEQIKNIIEQNKAVKLYGKYYFEYRKTLRQILYFYANKKKYNIAIWGAGLKGKAFLRAMDSKKEFIKYVYDIDKNKIGKVMPTGHTIVDYCSKYNQDVQIVLLMNNNYETETASLLEEHNLQVKLINIDSIIAGELSAREAVKLYGKEL